MSKPSERAEKKKAKVTPRQVGQLRKKEAAAKIPLPFAKPDSKVQREANAAARMQRRKLILKLASKEYEKHMPKIPLPEKFHTYSKSAKSLVSKKLVQAAQEQLKENNIRRIALTNAQRYVKEYKKRDTQLLARRRIAKQTNTFYVEAEPKVVFVIRIRGINGVSPKVRKGLQLLRLRQIHNGTFVKVNGASSQILKLVEPYVTYGAPSLRTVRALVYKRGYAKLGRDRVPLTNNTIVHDKLGTSGVHCMEDIIHEIFTCGPNFKKVNNFLWPFKLSSPKGGLVKKRVHFAEGGDAGDREHYINSLVKKMN